MTFTTFSRPIRKVKAEVVGLDVHKRTIVWCRLDRAGRIVGEGTISASRATLEALLDQQIGRRRTHVTLEASGCFLWAHDRLVERCGESRVHVAQARRIRMIAESRQKTDRTDAFWLAYFTHEGRLPEAWVPDGTRRELRLAARYRHEAVAEQTTCVVRIKSDFAQLGVPIVGAGLRTPKALSPVPSQVNLPQYAATRRTPQSRQRIRRPGAISRVPPGAAAAFVTKIPSQEILPQFTTTSPGGGQETRQSPWRDSVPGQGARPRVRQGHLTQYTPYTQYTARYNRSMTRDARVFDAFSEAESASRAQYAAMTPEERLALVLELSQREREDNGEAPARLARVYRVVELERR